MILEGGASGDIEMGQSMDIINKDYNLKLICQNYIAVYKKILKSKEMPFMLAVKSEMCKKRFAVSPLIAVYNYNVYLNNNGSLLKFTLNELEKNILYYCSIVKTKDEVLMEFKKK